MTLLLDTQIDIWAVSDSSRLNASVLSALSEPSNRVYFSSISIWEIAIKQKLERRSFRFDAETIHAGLLAAGMFELPLSSAHALAVRSLPLLHRDPFDRILVAQAAHEGMTLLTSDRALIGYGIRVWHVK